MRMIYEHPHRLSELDGQCTYLAADNENKGMNDSFTPSGKLKTILINESGLYALILSSKLPL